FTGGIMSLDAAQTPVHQTPAPQTPDPQIPAILDRLRAAFDSGLTRDLAWRRAQLAALKRMMVENEAEIASALKADLGKPFAEACTAEIDLVSSEAALARKHLGRWSRPQRTRTPLAIQPGKSFIESAPYGVTLIIGAWN